MHPAAPAQQGARRASRLEEVPATAHEVLALAGRLLAGVIELVVMEATSDWRIWYFLLENCRPNVQLVNPGHARQLSAAESRAFSSGVCSSHDFPSDWKNSTDGPANCRS
jgi:hypothetical protein